MRREYLSGRRRIRYGSGAAPRGPAPAIRRDPQGLWVRGLDLTYALLEPHDLVILVDACPRGDEPGTVYLVEPDPTEWNAPDGAHAHLETHAMNPMNVLRTVKAMGGTPGRILIVGCEPADIGSDEEGKLGLSGPVEAAVDEALRLIETLVLKVLKGELIEGKTESEIEGKTVAVQSH